MEKLGCQRCGPVPPLLRENLGAGVYCALSAQSWGEEHSTSEHKAFPPLPGSVTPEDKPVLGPISSQRSVGSYKLVSISQVREEEGRCRKYPPALSTAQETSDSWSSAPRIPDKAFRRSRPWGSLWKSWGYEVCGLIPSRRNWELGFIAKAYLGKESQEPRRIFKTAAQFTVNSEAPANARPRPDTG